VLRTAARFRVALIALVLVVLAAVEVRYVPPGVAVRWRAEVTAGERAALEQRFDLRNGELDEGSTSRWQYELGDRSRENVAALVAHPAAEDTHNRGTMEVARPGRCRSRRTTSA